MLNLLQSLFLSIFLLVSLGTTLDAGIVKNTAKAGAVYGASKVASNVVKKNLGRQGKQARLKELAKDNKLGSADKGWIQQEMNSIDRGQRKNIRNPIGKDLAHPRGKEASKGYGYEHANLQDKDLHKLQHKYDNFGKKNKESIPNKESSE